MGHTAEGVLRRLLDEPAGVADTDREHAAHCPRCQDALTAIREDAAVIGAMLTPDLGAGPDLDAGAGAGAGAGLGLGLDEDAAWQRLMAGISAPGASRSSTSRSSTGRSPAGRLITGRRSAGGWSGAGPRARRAVRRPVVAALAAAAVVLAGAGTAAANGWLQIFRVERVTVISLTASDLVTLPDLSAYGEVEVIRDLSLRDAADAADAQRRTGITLPDIRQLPRGVDGASLYQVADQAEGVFTFSTRRAAQAAAAEGGEIPPVPPGLDGTRVRLVAGPGVARVWPSSSGAPALLVARAVAPRAFSSGVPFETVRDYVLSLPGVPDEVAAQLRAYAADGSTLPLPVPADEATSRPVQVDGLPATEVVSRDGIFAAVVWVEDGILTLVSGSLSTDEVLTIARELR